MRPRKKSVRNVIEDDISDDEGDIDSDSSVISRNLTSSSVYSSQSELGGTEVSAGAVLYNKHPLVKQSAMRFQFPYSIDICLG